MSEHPSPLEQIRVPIPFDEIDACQIEPAIHRLIQAARERMKWLASESTPRRFDTLMQGLDRLTEVLDYAAGLVRHLESVATTPELRRAHEAIQEPLSSFYSSIPLDEALWKALQEYAATDEARNLTGYQQRFLKKTLEDFRRHGAELGPAGKRRLQEIEVELAQLTTKFAQNTLDATNAFELILEEEQQLAGLPESARELAREDAAARGKRGWRFSLHAPSYHAVMTYLDDGRIREHMYRAYNRRGAAPPWDNRPLIRRILELRREKAQLLGYPDFPSLVLEDRMARDPDQVQQFLEDLRAKTEPFFRKEHWELQEFRRQLEGPDAPPLQPWDLAYYAEKLRKAQFDFTDEDLRPYFPAEQVIRGLFELAERLFGIQIVPAGPVPLWDPSVRYYAVLDEDSNVLGTFYADWYPRDNKRPGAWMEALVFASQQNGHRYPHVGTICGNLNPPTQSRPALLTHEDVQTIFHEFGHLLHHILSRVPLRSLAGTNVAWDFVELPSQIMENWCWERESLDLFARHWQTGDPLPESLLAQLQRSRTFRAATAQMRQLGFGILDLALHRDYDPAREPDVVSYARRILQRFSPVPLPEDHAMICAFTHLFADPIGYAAGYYSYKWAEVLEADAFTRFKAAGVLDRLTGMEFREKILARGNSAEPLELFRSFLGRDPDPRALLERLGLTGQPAGAG